MRRPSLRARGRRRGRGCRAARAAPPARRERRDGAPTGRGAASRRRGSRARQPVAVADRAVSGADGARRQQLRERLGCDAPATRARRPAAKTSPRRASTHATSTPSPARSASSVETPLTGIPSANPSARAAARPMRSPVNVPGPVPATTRSRSAGVTPASSISRSTSASTRWAATERARVADSASARPSRQTHAVAMSVAVSSERISNRREQSWMFASQRDQPSIGLLQSQFHDEARCGQDACARLRPLDEARRHRRSTARGRPTPPATRRPSGRGRGATPGTRRPRSDGRP